MPLCLDPSKTYRIVLRSDEGKNPAPAFVCRYLTGREQMRMAEMLDDAQPNESWFGCIARVFDAVRPGVVKLEGMDGKAVEDVIGLEEAFELGYRQLAHNRLNADDAGKSGLPSPSGSAGSASPAAANALTDQAYPNPSAFSAPAATVEAVEPAMIEGTSCLTRAPENGRPRCSA